MQSLPSEYKYESFREYIQGLLDAVGVKLKVNAIIPYTFKFTGLTLDETEADRFYNFTRGVNLVVNTYTDITTDAALLSSFYFGNISIKTRCNSTTGTVNALGELLTAYRFGGSVVNVPFRFFEESVAAAGQVDGFFSAQDCFFNFLRLEGIGSGLDFLMKCNVDFTGFKITCN